MSTAIFQEITEKGRITRLIIKENQDLEVQCGMDVVKSLQTQTKEGLKENTKDEKMKMH